MKPQIRLVPEPSLYKHRHTRVPTIHSEPADGEECYRLVRQLLPFKFDRKKLVEPTLFSRVLVHHSVDIRSYSFVEDSVVTVGKSVNVSFFR